MQFKVERPVRKYEAVLILHPDLSEDQQKSFFKKNQKIIKDFGGDFHHIDTWGKRKLANPINKVRMGTYFHTTFEAKAEVIAELERTMRINDEVLRFCHQRLDDRFTMTKHLENYRDVLSASRQRDQEREAKAQARKQAKERRPARG